MTGVQGTSWGEVWSSVGGERGGEGLGHGGGIGEGGENEEVERSWGVGVGSGKG